MIAAEEWSRQQENYVRYGIDLQPGTHEEKRRKGKIASKRSAVTISANEKAVILTLIFAVGICCIAMIFIRAYTSDLSYSIYTLNQEMDEIEGDIDNLNVEIQSQNNLSQLEYYASNTLGMVYPESDQQISVSGLVGSEDVETYIAALSQSQKGAAVNKKITVAAAARQLLSQA